MPRCCQLGGVWNRHDNGLAAAHCVTVSGPIGSINPVMQYQALLAIVYRNTAVVIDSLNRLCNCVPIWIIYINIPPILHYCTVPDTVLVATETLGHLLWYKTEN